MSKDVIVAESSNLIPSERKGTFEQGYDKLGRPYEKKWDDNGIYTKSEVLLSGEPKLTIKKAKI